MELPGGILSGPAIKREVEQTGRISIDPFDSNQLNPASYDLRLGTEYAVYAFEGDPLPVGYQGQTQLDAKEKPKVRRYNFSIGVGLDLIPGRLYLMHTVERICTKHFVPVLDGKSSIGRLGVFTHVTAGYGDPGFDGQYTLEVTVVHPVRIYAGMRFAQMRFHTLVGQSVDYQESGHYKGAASSGPVPSMAYKQFEEDK